MTTPLQKIILFALRKRDKAKSQAHFCRVCGHALTGDWRIVCSEKCESEYASLYL